QRRPSPAQSGPRNAPTGNALTKIVSRRGSAFTPVTATTGAAKMASPMNTPLNAEKKLSDVRLCRVRGSARSNDWGSLWERVFMSSSPHFGSLYIPPERSPAPACGFALAHSVAKVVLFSIARLVQWRKELFARGGSVHEGSLSYRRLHRSRS